MQDLLFLALISYFIEWNYHACGLPDLFCSTVQTFTRTTVRSGSYIHSWVGTQHYPAGNKLGFKCMLAYHFFPHQNKANKKKMWGLPEGAGKTQQIMGIFLEGDLRSGFYSLPVLIKTYHGPLQKQKPHGETLFLNVNASLENNQLSLMACASSRRSFFVV